MSDHFTHPEKILYPESGITKGQLGEYYLTVQKWILPHVINRPLTLVRCPSGIDHECFFQKHADKNVSDNIHTQETWIYIENIEGLLSLVQLGVLEIHAWGSKIDNIEKPDRIVFDLDPHESVAWPDVQAAALLIKDQLEKIHLKSFVKTTGGKGLHIVIPIVPDKGWGDIKDFSHAMAKLMEKQYPDIFISNMSKSKRTGKIFLDYLRNGRGATAVIAFSTRAKPNAPVSAPLAWDELLPNITPNFYTINNLPKRLEQLKADPWKGFGTLKQKLNIG